MTRPTSADIQKKLRHTLKQEFKHLYVERFTTDWREQRIVRETEIDVMSWCGMEALVMAEIQKAFNRGYQCRQEELRQEEAEVQS